jgi:hypothetical protein
MLPSRALEAAGLAGRQSLARHTGAPVGVLSLLDVAAHTEELAAAICSHTVGVDVLGSLSAGHGMHRGDTAAETEARRVLAFVSAAAGPVLGGGSSSDRSPEAHSRSGRDETSVPDRLWCCHTCTGKVLYI